MFSFVDIVQVQGIDIFDVNDCIEMMFFVLIFDVFCNFCQINQDSDFFEINYVVIVCVIWILLVVGVGGGVNDILLVCKDVIVMFEMQFWGKMMNQYVVVVSEVFKIKF